MAQDNDDEQGGRGFAGTDEERQREAASKGGEESGDNPQNLGNADRSEAGRKGGESVVEKYGPEHMSEIGSKGGQSSGGNVENLQQGGGNQGNQGNAPDLPQGDRRKGGERSGGGQ